MSITRVLVVDDDLRMRELIATVLGAAGFEVCGEAGDGETAVRSARALQPDVVTMDVEMPILDGLSATRRIVALNLAPVVIVSGSRAGSESDAAVAAGASCHLPKTSVAWALPLAVRFTAELARERRELHTRTRRAS
ncbi:MAG: response regulator [Gaiellaceae bacterium]